ncbi:hypothetical protein CWI42_091620 [Ordospora colligata]|uniref:Uncharacterized protein n=1 Tax=Ordospora colligata OC4 TaxID=1354746 RepID=A0A0B2UDX5_9MICR|nr:uncharacterized protein M896_091640 [Ordospora colligata OC4]KHN69236.1 hypothetical protein M896_091640 [Ordospora colligata OC4]TBU14514.1 hypothetical protein CWI40_091600 [Ordospora colligata]TBU14691.1 hypothetical protein CWI41_091630 [Ordospora colligata]TBU18076.1 hypothetical protein CWI42_091620 [Ordospora colligata]
MDKIDLDNVDDAIKREKLFLKAAKECLAKMEFKLVDKEHVGVLMRTQKEIDMCEKFGQLRAERMTKKHAERRIQKKSRKVDEDSDDLGPEEFIAPMISNKDNRKKNKKKLYKNNSERRRKMKSRQKRHRH